MPARFKQGNGQVMKIVQENINLLLEHEEKRKENRTLLEKAAYVITEGIGSITSVLVHAIFFFVWIILNIGAFGLKPFDPFPFGFLTMIVSLEAIFLSLFVLITQNQMQIESDNRAELDVQINLLTEHELTRLIRLVDLVADKVGVDRSKDPELKALQVDIDPGDVIEQIEGRHEQRKLNEEV